MSERFDDSIKKQLEGLESPVPQDMFDKIRNHPDVSNAMFDADISNALQTLESPISAGQFDKMYAGADLENASFDEAIQEKMNVFESAIPADMWNRITERKRRRRPVAWWVAAGFVLFLGGGTWYRFHHIKQAAISGNDIIVDKKIASERESSLPEKNSSSQKNNVPVVFDTALQSATYSLKENTAPQKTYTNSPLLKPSNRAKFSNTNKEPKASEQFVSVTDIKNRNQREAGSSYATKKIIANGLATEKEIPTVLNSSTIENGSQINELESTLNTVRLAIVQQLRSAVRLMPGQLLKAKPRSPVIPCPVDADEGRNDWYIDVYSSAFIVNKNISDKEPGKNAKNGFDSTLHRQVSFNAGISLVKNIGENILLKTGLQYNRLNESFRLTRINERKLVTVVSVRTVIIAPGDTVYIRDTSVTETIGTIQNRHQNVYKQWDIPLIIGYEFGGENVRLNANAGIIANIRSTYSGEILDDSLLRIIDASNYNGKPVYKTNVGFSIYAGLSILKTLGEKTSLLIEPYARIGLGNTTNDNAWFRQKNNAAGISIGIRYKLNSGGQRR